MDTGVALADVEPSVPETLDQLIESIPAAQFSRAVHSEKRQRCGRAFSVWALAPRPNSKVQH